MSREAQLLLGPLQLSCPEVTSSLQSGLRASKVTGHLSICASRLSDTEESKVTPKPFRLPSEYRAPCGQPHPFFQAPPRCGGLHTPFPYRVSVSCPHARPVPTPPACGHTVTCVSDRPLSIRTHTAPLGPGHLRQELTGLREALSYVDLPGKERQGEERSQPESGRVRSGGVPRAAGAAFPARRCSPPRTWAIFTEVRPINSIPAPSRPPGHMGWCRKF